MELLTHKVSMAQFSYLQRLTVIPKRLAIPNIWIGHIPFAFCLIPMLKPRILVELGTLSGNSFFAFCEAVKENKLNTICYAIDTWLGDKHSGDFAQQVYGDVIKYREKNYRINTELLRMTFDEALNRFENRSIDLLHIDGLHTYAAVKHDFENWLPKLSENAVVLFHDTQVKMKDFGVWKYWEEIRSDYPSFEFYHSYGLGILAVGKNVPGEVLEFIEKANKERGFRKPFEKQSKKINREYWKRRVIGKIRRTFSLNTN